MSLKDTIAVVASICALAISLYTFFRDNLINQHVLKASVVTVGNFASAPYVDILLINPGKHYETLYKARLIYASDLAQSGGERSQEFVGPIVLEPGKAITVRLEVKPLDIRAMRERGLIKPPNGLHVGVDFEPVTPGGELRDDHRTYRVTELAVEGDHLVGAKPKLGDQTGFMDLL